MTTAAFCSTGETCSCRRLRRRRRDRLLGSDDQCNARGVQRDHSTLRGPDGRTKVSAATTALFCTTGETCTLRCSCGGGTAIDCSSADDQCNVGVCNETTRPACEAQTPINEGLGCDDGAVLHHRRDLHGRCLRRWRRDRLLGLRRPVQHRGVQRGTLDSCEASSHQRRSRLRRHPVLHHGRDVQLRCVRRWHRDRLLGLRRPVQHRGVQRGNARSMRGLKPTNEGLGCDDGPCSAPPVRPARPVLCGGGGAIDCSGSGDQCNTGVCNETFDSCEASPINEGLGCDDTLFCTTGETCTAGVCDGGTAIDCSGSGDQCNVGVCNETLGPVRGVRPTNEGLGCDDTAVLHHGRDLLLRVCDGGTAIDCSGSGDQCNVGVCNETLDQPARLRPRTKVSAATTPCSAPRVRPALRVCATVAPRSTARAPATSATSVCATRRTSARPRPPTKVSAATTDPVLHHGRDLQLPGVCDGGTAIDCSGSGDQCNTGVCNETLDQCEASPTNEGLGCDDTLFCTTGETCSSGVAATAAVQSTARAPATSATPGCATRR